MESLIAMKAEIMNNIELLKKLLEHFEKFEIAHNASLTEENREAEEVEETIEEEVEETIEEEANETEIEVVIEKEAINEEQYNSCLI